MAAISFFGPLGPGHVNPTLGIVTELVRRGHAVTYYAPRMFAERIEEAGARFEAVTCTPVSCSCCSARRATCAARG